VHDLALNLFLVFGVFENITDLTLLGVAMMKLLRGMSACL
jgi:hypothetical protein